jgi:hydrogenase maturation protease
MPHVVVVGYGNPLRGDDGVGWRVAEAIAQRWADHVTIRVGQQLLPEWAADLADAQVVFIIDASMTNRSPPA